MEKLGFGLDDEPATCDQKQTNPQEMRLLAIQRCIKYLVHAFQCRGANCRLLSCQRMKRVLQHAKGCKLKTNNGCPVCKQLAALCCHHAIHCREATCPVPFCINIKNKFFKHQQLQQRLQQAQILKRPIATMQRHVATMQRRIATKQRRIATMQNCVGLIATKQRRLATMQNCVATMQNWIATMQNCSMSGAVFQLSPGNSNSSSQPSPGAQPHSSPHQPQPGIGMKPSTGPPVGALQAVQQVQAAAARQTAPHMVAASVNYGKGNPVVSPPNANTGLMTSTQQMQTSMQKLMSQMMSGVPNRNMVPLNMGNVTCWEGPGYAQNPQPHQNPQP